MFFRNRVALAAATVVLLGVAGVLTYPYIQSREPQKSSDAPGSESSPVAATMAGKWEAGQPAPFDADRAMDYLRDLCKLGQRISGSEPMAKQQELLKKHFEDLGAKVALQKFVGTQESQAKPVAMANMIVSWHPEAKRRIILCGHYDCRPIADQEFNTDDWKKHFDSANDGTSTVALLMELGRHMPGAPKLNVGVDFVFFDGEEWMYDPKVDRFFLGSEHFAKDYRDHKPAYRYSAAVLMDLIAGKNAKYPLEENSRFEAGELLEDVWTIAGDLKVPNFLFERARNYPGGVQDDHLALNRIAKIPAIDIIDFDYPHWHRLSDTPENCSGESLARVAKVLSVWMQKAK